MAEVVSSFRAENGFILITQPVNHKRKQSPIFKEPKRLIGKGIIK